MDTSSLLQFTPLVFVGSIIAVVVWSTGTILKKTGRSRTLGLLWLVPIVNFFFLLWLARTEWPIEREVQALRESVALLQRIKAT